MSDDAPGHEAPEPAAKPDNAVRTGVSWWRKFLQIRLFGKRMRVSTMVLIVVFIALMFAYGHTSSYYKTRDAQVAQRQAVESAQRAAELRSISESYTPPATMHSQSSAVTSLPSPAMSSLPLPATSAAQGGADDRSAEHIQTEAPTRTGWPVPSREPNIEQERTPTVVPSVGQ